MWSRHDLQVMFDDGAGMEVPALEGRGGPTRQAGVSAPAWVVSPHSLVAQAVAAALSSTGASVEFHAWESLQECRPHGSSGPAVRHVLAIFDGVAPASTIEEISQLVADGGVRVAVVTSAPDALGWGGLLQGNAVDVVTMTTSVAQLAEVVRRFVAGEVLMEPERRRIHRVAWLEALDKRHDLVLLLGTLSPRQLRVLELLADGHRVAEVAEVIGVTDATVRSHVKTLRAKLRARTQLEAVAMLRRAQDVGDGTDLVPRPRRPPVGSARTAVRR